MAEIKELLEQFKYYAENPRKQLDKYLAEGKKAVGIFPYYAPEEIVYAVQLRKQKIISRLFIIHWH